MLKTQKQRCRQPVIAHLLNAQQNKSRKSSRGRDIIEQLSKRRMKVIQTKSDNNHDRKTIEQKKLKSLNLLPKQQLRIPYEEDQYQLGTNNNDRWRVNKEKQIPQKNNNQCLRDDTSSSNYGQIVSHYRQSKSRYKNGKEKARKLIDKMLAASKHNSEEVQNHLTQNIQKMKQQFIAQNNATKEYGMYQRGLQKCSSTSSSTGFKPKVQKCSTLRFGTKQSSGSSAHKYSRPLSKVSYTSSNHRLSNQSLNRPSISSNRDKSSLKQKSSIREKQYGYQKKNQENGNNSNNRISQKQVSTTIISSEDATANPLVVKERLAQYGFTDYDRPTTQRDIQLKQVTQKEINQESEKTTRQASRQMRLSRKQTQKLITRARQKNKKILGKLKQLKQKRSAFRNSMMSNTLNNTELGKSVSRFSKLNLGLSNNANNFKSNLRQSIIQSKLLQRSGHNKRAERDSIDSNNFILSVNSNLQSQSTLAMNQQIKQKILIHLQTIKTIADYAQSFGNIYQDCNQWEDLIFLLYKKYYMERFKIYCMIKKGKVQFKDGSIYQQSPLVFDFCSVTEQEIQNFRQSKQQISIQFQLQLQNQSIKSSLRDLYNKFIQKTAQNPSINMYDVDDFSQEILQDLNQQINMLIQSCGKSTKIKKRINQAIQVSLLIAHLEGYVLEDIEDIAFGQVEQREYFDKYYSKFMEIFGQQDEQKNM